MKVFNLKRGQGKTVRMIYASELHNVPIICANDTHAKHIISVARRLSVNIPEPITVRELVYTKKGTGIEDVLVDESLLVLQTILNNLSNRPINIIAATVNIDDK